MMRNIKTLGLLAIAATALVAFVGTSSAMAEKGKFTAGEEGKALTTTTIKNHVFKVTGNEVTCKKVSFVGVTGPKSYTAQVVNPSYEECTAFGFPATVHANSCEFKFTSTTPAGKTHAEVHLEGCSERGAAAKTAGIQLTVKVPFTAECIVDVPEQTIPEAVHYTTNAPPADDIVVEATASGIMVDVTKSTGLCPLSTSLATHTGANGATYTGSSTVQAAGGITHSPTA